MKKTHLTWLMAFMMLVFANFGFTSCGDDDDEVSAETLAGTWKYSYAEITFEGETVPASDWGYEADESTTVTFNSDNTYEYNGVKKGTWSLDGNQLILSYAEYPDVTDTSTVSISGKNLTITTEMEVVGVITGTAILTTTYTK